MNKNLDYKPVCIRLPSALYEGIRSQAEKEHRSVTGEVRAAISYYLNEISVKQKQENDKEKSTA